MNCRDMCGASVADQDAAMQAGWSYLHVAGGWRCGACTHTLALAARLQGTEAAYTPDPLPPHSRGALPKETASGILPPTVKAS